MLQRTALHPYQQRMVDWIHGHPRTCLFAGMGVGKTVAALTAIVDLFAEFAVSRVLIVAPLRVARSTWPEELRTWEHTRRLSYRVIQGVPWERKRQVHGDEQIHIINVDLFAWLVAECGNAWPYDMLVIDESTLFKNPSSQRFKALKRVARRADYYIALTGTPAPNGLLDLWAQVWPIDFGASILGRSMTAYKQRWFDSDFMGYTWTPRAHAQQEIEQALAPHCLSLSAASLFDLPERIDNQIKVELPVKSRAQYKTLEREFLLELEQTEVTAANAAVLSGKLLQFTAGALYDESGAWVRVHDAKLDALQDVIEEAAGAPVLVAYQFRSDLERLQARFPQARVLDKDPATLYQWNAGKVPVLLLHPASAGHGLSLQHGGNIIVFFNFGWNLEQYQQVVERIGPTRQKQSGYDRPVFVHHIIASGTIDERVLSVLQGKATVQEAMMQALKEAA